MENRIKEINSAIDNLIPNICFLSLMMGTISDTVVKKNDEDESIEYLQRYYKLKELIENAGFQAELGDDLEQEERYWSYYIDFSNQWNDTIKKIRGSNRPCKKDNFGFCKKLFSLPGGHYIEPVVSLTENLDGNPIWLKAQKEAINKALERNSIEDRINIEKASQCEYENFIENLLELREKINSFRVNSDYQDIDNDVAEVQEWIRRYILLDELNGEFKENSYLEEFFDKVEMLYFEDVSERDIKGLVHNLDKLIRCIVEYFGEDYREISNLYLEDIEEY